MKKKTIQYKKEQRAIKAKNRNDFWFSEKHLRCLSRFGRNRCMCKFKSQLFTEQIAPGHTPMSYHFGDLVYLGRGDTWEDCTYKIITN